MMVCGRRLCACLLLLLGALIAACSGLAATPALGSPGRARGASAIGWFMRSHDRTAFTGRARPSQPPRAVESIVGGAGASIARFPFQVALYNPRAGSPAAGFFCGGVIIDATHVATAAHCIATGAHGQAGPLGEIEVLAGSTQPDPDRPRQRQRSGGGRGV